MSWSISRSLPTTHTTYITTVPIEGLLGHPVTTKDDIIAVTQDMKSFMPEGLYAANLTWMEQMLQQFANDTKDKPEYLHRVFCNVARGVSLYDNTRCINCCNRFTQNLFAACNVAHNFVILERVEEGMLIKVMDYATFTKECGQDVYNIIEASLIHHAEEAEDHAD